MSLFDQLKEKSNAASTPGGMQEQAQFVEYIKLQAYADQYIDRQEEYRILEKGIDLGIAIDQGRKLLEDTAARMNWVLESAIEDKAVEQLATYADAHKHVDKKGFMQIANQLSQASQGQIKEDEAKRRLKKMLLDRGIAYREGGVFGSDWLSDIH